MPIHLLLAFFPAHRPVNDAVAGLLAAGVAPEDVRALLDASADLDVRPTTRAAEGAALGGASCGLFGAVFGGLAAGGALVFPSVGTVLAGPTVAALALAGALGTAGLLMGALLGARLSRYEVGHRRAYGFAEGGWLLVVRCEATRAAPLERILERSGALRITRGRARPTG